MKKIGYTTKEKASEKIELGRDEVQDFFPIFNSDKADTKNNKKRLREFLGLEITPDIKNIYCFDDAIGIDSDYMFAFNCDAESSEKIIQKHHLKKDEHSENAFGLQHNFSWWNKEEIAKLDLYSWNKDQQYFKYYWYDEKNKKSYYFEFTM